MQRKENGIKSRTVNLSLFQSADFFMKEDEREG